MSHIYFIGWTFLRREDQSDNGQELIYGEVLMSWKSCTLMETPALQACLLTNVFPSFQFNSL